MLLAQLAWSQSYDLSGVVRDSLSNEPLLGVRVTLSDIVDPTITISDTTNTYGEYSLSLAIVAVDDVITPSHFGIGQNYPQPFNPSTTIPFTIEREGRYWLKAYDLRGREISSKPFYSQPGQYSVRFQSASSGVFFVRLTGEEDADVIKVVALDGMSSTSFSEVGAHHSIRTALAKPADNERMFTVTAIGEYLNTIQDEVELSEGGNQLDLELTRNNYPPYLYFNIATDTIGYNADTPALLAICNYNDPDGDQGSYEFFNNRPDSAFISIEYEPFPHIWLDSIASGFSGIVEYGLSVSALGGADTVITPLMIMPEPNHIPITFVFKAVYDDTLLWNGTSTIKQRLMNPSGETFLWDQDSIHTSEDGSITVHLMEGQNYSIRARHTDEYELDISVSYFKIPGVVGTVGQESANTLSGGDVDTANVMSFDSNVDTVYVLKIMNGFPLAYTATYVDPQSEGIRRFPEWLVDVPFRGNLNYTALNESQVAAVELFIEEWTSIPQIERTGHFYQSAEYPETPFVGISLDPSFQYASNSATWDDNTNEISVASASGREYIIPQDLNQEIAEAMTDNRDAAGDSPGWVSNDGRLTELGKQALCIVYLSRPGTLFY